MPNQRSNDGATTEIERDIEMSRDRLAETLRSVERRLSPDLLIQRATDLLKATVGQVGSGLSRPLDQQIPLVLLGAGLGWLLLGRMAGTGPLYPISDGSLAYARTKTEPSNGQDTSMLSRAREASERNPIVVGLLGGLVGAAVAVALSKARSAEILSQAQESVSNAVSTLVSDTVSRIGDAAIETVGEVGAKLKDAVGQSKPAVYRHDGRSTPGTEPQPSGR